MVVKKDRGYENEWLKFGYLECFSKRFQDMSKASRLVGGVSRSARYLAEEISRDNLFLSGKIDKYIL